MCLACEEDETSRNGSLVLYYPTLGGAGLRSFNASRDFITPTGLSAVAPFHWGLGQRERLHGLPALVTNFDLAETRFKLACAVAKGASSEWHTSSWSKRSGDGASWWLGDQGWGPTSKMRVSLVALYLQATRGAPKGSSDKITTPDWLSNGGMVPSDVRRA